MEFISNFLVETSHIVNHLDKNKILDAIHLIKKMKDEKGRLFIIGVGGSSANSSHAVNDFRKLCNIEAYSPTDNISEITARTNDEGWETVFSEYLKVSKLNSKDLLLILSVGGGNLDKKISENICNAIIFAKSTNTKTIGIVGRTDGYTANNSDVTVLIPETSVSNLTPHSESFQSIIWHLVVMHPLLKENKTKW